MAQQNKIVGYTNIFGFVLPDWVDEGLIRQIVMMLLIILAMLSVYLFVINPKLSTIKGLRSTLKAREDSLTVLNNSKREYEKMSEQIPEATQNKILSAIPLTYSPDEAIFLLRKLCTESGVSIVSYKLPSGDVFTANEVKTDKGSSGRMVDYFTHQIRITVSSSVPSILSFIDKVEKSLPYGVVSDVNMQEVTKISETSKNVQMELEISYYQASLNKIDITKVKPFTESDLTLVNEITGFSVFSAPVSSADETAGNGGGINDNIFGI